ncbi:MAG: erythromycin esterase family protein [Bryobacteraceae bacterium]
MSGSAIDEQVYTVCESAAPLTESEEAYDPLLESIGGAKFVLLGEASHGTDEFYRERARITRRLILEKGFNAVAVEADWPDAYLVNRYVRGSDDARDPMEALRGFDRFPKWMWRNTAVLDFIRWLRAHNDACSDEAEKTGFYGIDLYSLHGSIDAVLRYLDRVDPEAARRARERYACFEHFGEDPQLYGARAGFDLSASCEQAVIEQLLELQRHAPNFKERNGRLAADEYFFAEQNALLVKNAENYYRAMFRSREHSWNLRDRHMAESLDNLAAHIEQSDGACKVVVWAHNSHVGDARATEMSARGELNLGQLVRERHTRDVFTTGFSTYTGTVTAASRWGGPAETMKLRPAMPGSYEALFHRLRLPRFLLSMRHDGESLLHLSDPRLERAIGVIYRPESERISHYFQAVLRDQFDAVLHFDETRSVEPLDRPVVTVPGGEAETFPWGV